MNFRSKSFLKGFLALFFVVSFFSTSIFASKADIVINEVFEQNKISDGKYAVEVKGSLKIKNPSAISKIYEINIPLKLDSLIGITKVNSSSSSDKFIFDYNSISAYLLNQSEEISVDYVIYGIVNYDLGAVTVDEDLSVLEYYAENFDLYSNVIIGLDKVQREGFMYDDDADRSQVSEPLDNTSRLVVANIRNPTDFDYYLREVVLYRTQTSNPMFGEGDMIKTFYNLSIAPYDFQELNAFDPEATDNSVYWVSSHVSIDSYVQSTIKYKPVSVVNVGDGVGAGDSSYIPTFGYKTNILVKKNTDKTLINSGEEFEVTVTIINVGGVDIHDLVLFDEIPMYHSIKDVSNGVRILNETKLIFDIDTIEAYGEFVVKYTLTNKEDVKGITFLKPARVNFNDNSFFSDGVLIINDLLPNKKVFIQKAVEYVDDDFARITITVKNLGAQTLRNILVSDFLDENSMIKDITQVFEDRGVWNIKILKAGEEWEVSYMIERNPKIETLPNLFGVDNSEVFGTLVFSEEIVTIFSEQPKTVEKIGMIVAVGLLIFYLLF